MAAVLMKNLINYLMMLGYYQMVYGVLCEFLPRDASAERGDATVSCPSVRL